MVNEQIKKKITDYINAYFGGAKQFSQDEYEDALLYLFNYCDKHISICKRNIVESTVLQHKIINNEIPDVIVNNYNELKNMVKNGININDYLSKKTEEDYIDNMLTFYSIKHIHLENIKDIYSDSYYLLVLENDDYMYCIDICKHLHDDEFASLEYLRIIIKEHWESIAGFHCISATPKFLINDKSTISELWKSNINPSVFEIDGKTYVSQNGKTMNGENIANVNVLLDFNRAASKHIDCDIKVENYNIEISLK